MSNITNKNNFFSIIYSIICLLTLVSFASSPLISVTGAKSGLLLWFNNIIPTLLPFIIIINLLNRLGGFLFIEKLFGPFFQKILHLNASYSHAVIPGLICGYPSGAVCSVNMYDKGIISKSECEFLCIISGFISPMFLSGYVFTMQKKSITDIIIILISVYAPRLFLLPLYKKIYHITGCDFECNNVINSNNSNQYHNLLSYNNTDNQYNVSSIISSIDDAIISGSQIVLKAGGYIIMCSVLTEYILNLSLENSIIKAFLLCFIEITKGINYTYKVITNHILCNLIIIIAICFGGICISMQVFGVVKKADISIRHYLIARLCEALTGGIIYIILEIGYY